MQICTLISLPLQECPSVRTPRPGEIACPDDGMLQALPMTHQEVNRWRLSSEGGQRTADYWVDIRWWWWQSQTIPQEEGGAQLAGWLHTGRRKCDSFRARPESSHWICPCRTTVTSQVTIEKLMASFTTYGFPVTLSSQTMEVCSWAKSLSSSSGTMESSTLKHPHIIQLPQREQSKPWSKH